MDISTSNNTDMSTIQVDALQKSLEINQREALKDCFVPRDDTSACGFVRHETAQIM